MRISDWSSDVCSSDLSRPLRSEFLASDLGIDSAAYKNSAAPLSLLVDEGRKADPSAGLATDLWSQFVDHLEGPAGTFRTTAYVDEAYVTLLERILSANVLTGKARSDEHTSELK